MNRLLFLSSILLPLATLLAAAGACADERTDLLKQVGIDQHIGARVPSDIKFQDEDGHPVTLDRYFRGDRPIILSLVYFKCPMLCTTVLNELNVSMNTMPEGFDVGKKYDVLTISFNPQDTWELAHDKRKTYLRQYGRAGGEQGWHFLTGDQESIDRLTKAVGFRFVRDPKPYSGGSFGGPGGFIGTPVQSANTDTQFIHAGGIMVLTPTGMISKYFYGINYAPKDLRLALIEAGQEKSGTLSDAVLLFCFHYDASTGKYTVAILNIMKLVAALLLVVMAFFWTRAIWREHKRRRQPPFMPAVPPGLG